MSIAKTEIRSTFTLRKQALLNHPIQPRRPTIPNQTLTQTLLAAELQLLDPGIRRNPRLAAQLLAENFREFGQSGRVYDKTSILALLASQAPQTITLEDFQATTLGPDAALCTYLSHSPQGRARRSSVWQWRQGRWQILFHQGTPIPPETLDPAEEQPA